MKSFGQTKLYQIVTKTTDEQTEAEKCLLDLNTHNITLFVTTQESTITDPLLYS